MRKVAVYGSLRKGLHNHSVLGDSKQLGEDELEGFSMYSLGCYPYVRPDGSDKTIKVEIYEVNDATSDRLDILEGYREGGDSYYDRKEVETSLGTAWIYFIDEDPCGSPEVHGGDWKEYYSEDSLHY